jgi:hypothetical protein
MAKTYRPYGTLVETVKKNSHGNKFGLRDRTLEIYETKRMRKGIVYDSSRKGWKNVDCVIAIGYFDRSTDTDHIKKSFGY